MIWRGKLIKRIASPENPNLRILRVRRLFGELFRCTQYDTANVDSCPHRTAEPLLEPIAGDLGLLAARSFIDGVARKSREGEFSAYSTDGKKRVAEIWLRKNGVAAINGDTHSGMVKIVELTAAINALIAQLQAHTHNGGMVPDQTFTPFVKENYENATVLHGSGEGI